MDARVDAARRLGARVRRFTHPLASPPYEILYEIRTVRRERVLGTCVRPGVAEPDCEPVHQRVPRRSSLADRRPHTGPRQHTCEHVHLHPHPLTRDSFRRGERGVGVYIADAKQATGQLITEIKIGQRMLVIIESSARYAQAMEAAARQRQQSYDDG